ncbi:MAG: HAD-IA family hydrolase [Anaerolineae bacterium]
MPSVTASHSPRMTCLAFEGVSAETVAHDLFGERSLTEAEIATYLETKDHYYLDLVRQSKPANLLAPGAEALVDTARARNLKLGVASSSNAITVCATSGLYDMVEVVADLAQPSPIPSQRPTFFIWTAGALGVSPIRCLAFEDSHAGVAAAHQAGMFVVGIGAQLIDQAH